MSSTALSVSVTRSLEFFFVSTGREEGFAEVIMWPALMARVKRRSRIFWRSGSAIVAGQWLWSFGYGLERKVVNSIVLL